MKTKKVTIDILSVLNQIISKHLYKRLSPFLMLVPVLLLLFLMLIIINKENEWTTILLLPVIIINLLFLDFAFWNYFEGKQKGRIWMIETCIVIPVVFYMLSF